MLGPRGVQITEMISETILFVYKADHFPFNAQHNTYEYHYLDGRDFLMYVFIVSPLYAVLTSRALGRTARIFKTVLYV